MFAPPGPAPACRPAPALALWAEAAVLGRLESGALYAPLSPPPRSTIAAAFSPDGRLLASTQ